MAQDVLDLTAAEVASVVLVDSSTVHTVLGRSFTVGKLTVRDADPSVTGDQLWARWRESGIAGYAFAPLSSISSIRTSETT